MSKLITCLSSQPPPEGQGTLDFRTSMTSCLPTSRASSWTCPSSYKCTMYFHQSAPPLIPHSWGARSWRTTYISVSVSDMKKFLCDFCHKRYGTAGILQVGNIFIICQCQSGPCLDKPQRGEESAECPANGNIYSIWQMRSKSFNKGDAEYCDARYIIILRSVMQYNFNAQ